MIYGTKRWPFCHLRLDTVAVAGVFGVIAFFRSLSHWMVDVDINAFEWIFRKIIFSVFSPNIGGYQNYYYFLWLLEKTDAGQAMRRNAPTPTHTIQVPKSTTMATTATEFVART